MDGKDILLVQSVAIVNGQENHSCDTALIIILFDIRIDLHTLCVLLVGCKQNKKICTHKAPITKQHSSY